MTATTPNNTTSEDGIALLPDITTPLVRPGNGQKMADIAAGLGELVGLVGNWNSPPGAMATGYNVMPVPAAGAPGGFQLINGPYFEQMTISALPGNAANRGGTFQQVAWPLFYEQRVYFGAGPNENTVVHAENGSWLHLTYGQQPDEPPTTMTQPPATAYVKQVSVPHGNDVLATGTSVGPYDGAPKAFPTADKTALPFSDPSLGVIDPNVMLQKQLDALEASGVTVVKTTEIHVDTDNPGGAMTNIDFEKRHANVTRFASTWFIEELSNGSCQLQYSQTMWLSLLIGDSFERFVHIDTNTLVPAR